MQINMYAVQLNNCEEMRIYVCVCRMAHATVFFEIGTIVIVLQFDNGGMTSKYEYEFVKVNS